MKRLLDFGQCLGKLARCRTAVPIRETNQTWLLFLRMEIKDRLASEIWRQAHASWRARLREMM
jgi:hypothetical protein